MTAARVNSAVGSLVSQPRSRQKATVERSAARLRFHVVGAARAHRVQNRLYATKLGWRVLIGDVK